MLNETELSFIEADNSTSFQAPMSQLDEASYSIFFSSFSPNSPAYSSNVTGFGINFGTLKFCVQGVGITCVALMGIVGSILSIVVLSSPRMRNSSSCFLLCLAICDLITLIGAILLVGIPSILTYDPTDEKHFVYNKNIAAFGNVLPSIGLFAISVTALCGSIFFTMALTLERYFAVCKPFYARHLCTWSRASFVSAIIIIITILYNLPRWWEFTYVAERTSNNLTLYYRPFPTPMRINQLYDTYYVHVAYFVFQFFAPVCFLIVFNILIYREIKQANTLRKSISPSQKHENSLTRMLFGVVAVFLTCQLSPAIHILYRYAEGSREFVPEAETLWTFMIILNSSVNFLIYCSAGAKFREVFCDMFFHCKSGNRFRQFTASTKTTLQSLSISSRRKSYCIQSQRNGPSGTALEKPISVVAVPSLPHSHVVNELG